MNENLKVSFYLKREHKSARNDEVYPSFGHGGRQTTANLHHLPDNQ